VCLEGGRSGELVESFFNPERYQRYNELSAKMSLAGAEPPA
jgi:hypothetical protein